MFSIPLVFAITGGYVALLFIVAFWIERNSSWGEKLSNSPFVYALSLGVYCTAWTYYGSVGKAATSGMLFLTMYLGPTLGIVFWWVLLRKLVRIKNAHRITSIADFISSRYNKSEVLAALATIVAVVGSLPYLALQLKAIFTTITLITNSTPQSASSPLTLEQVHILVLVILILFTILLGVRRLDPTERHRGVMVALALESIVKLVAFIAVGIFVTYYINHGLLDIMTSISKEAVAPLVHDINPEGRSYLTWVTYLLLSMSAILFVPRQFHVAVVENSNEKHIRTAMWMFPLYMFLINFFIYPVAMGGLLAGQPLAQADSFVLSLPSISGNQGLVLLVFIGGVSAATGMVFAESMTISTMVTNHLILPLVSRVKSLGFLRRHLLSCRWLVVIGFILLGYLFTVKIAVTFTLVDIGMIAFAAFLQFAPPIVAGLFWPRANKTGAISGLTAGFVLWSYTLLMPTFIKGGWLPSSILTKGPWGIALLNPEHLFGVFISNPLIHGVFWSLLCNIGLLVAGSVLSRQDEEEQRIADSFVNIFLTGKGAFPYIAPSKPEIDAWRKRKIIENVFKQYLPPDKAVEIMERCFREAKIEGKTKISMIELAELHNRTEIVLSGLMGSAAAHKALLEAQLFTLNESEQLQEMYAEIFAELKVTPRDLKSKVDYYQEKQAMLTRHALELEDKIKELEKNIQERKQAEQALHEIQGELEKRVAARTRDLVLANEQLGREVNERKSAEEALQESKQRLADIIDFSPDAMFAIDAEGRVVAWNKATEEMTGVKAKDMLGKGGYECAVPFYGEKRRLLANILLEAVDIEKYSPRIAQEYPAVWKENDILMTEANLANVNGKPMIAWAKAAPLYDKNGKLSAVIQTVRDITERKNVEEEAKRNYAVQSVISALQKLALEDISLDQILDRSLDIILGISWFDLGGKAAIFTVEADADILVMSAQRGLSPANQEACRRIEFGQCLCGKAARDKELEFALDVEGCHKISYAEIIPHGHYCVPILSIDRKTIGVLTIYSKDGQSRDQSKEEFLQLVANVLAGIIQRKYAEAALEKAYEQLKQTQSQLVQSSKMASVGELAGGVAHEINNPLTGVLNNVQLVKMMAREKKDFSMEEYRDILNCIEESALRCKRITESLLTFSHVASGLFQPVSLNDAVEKVIILVEHELKLQNITIQSRLQPDLRLVTADSQLLQQVVLDIISNARWALRERPQPAAPGVIAITTRNNIGKAEVVMEIADNGIGIPPENINHIFDPFFTTKKVGEGTGLGLSIVYNIIKQHKGSITVTSQTGRETAFIITFPGLPERSKPLS